MPGAVGGSERREHSAHMAAPASETAALAPGPVEGTVVAKLDDTGLKQILRQGDDEDDDIGEYIKSMVRTTRSPCLPLLHGTGTMACAPASV